MPMRTYALRPVEEGQMRMPSWPATARAVAKVALWPVFALIRLQARTMERDVIARMDSRVLRDIGLNRADVLAEIEKPIWR